MPLLCGGTAEGEEVKRVWPCNYYFHDAGEQPMCALVMQICKVPSGNVLECPVVPQWRMRLYIWLQDNVVARLGLAIARATMRRGKK